MLTDMSSSLSDSGNIWQYGVHSEWPYVDLQMVNSNATHIWEITLAMLNESSSLKRHLTYTDANGFMSLTKDLRQLEIIPLQMQRWLMQQQHSTAIRL
jgi:hypothetical protein